MLQLSDQRRHASQAARVAQPLGGGHRDARIGAGQVGDERFYGFRTADVSERHLANLEYGLGNASILVLLIAAVGAHFSMTGLCLLFFGPEGLRAKPLVTASFTAGPLPVSGQSIAIYLAALGLMLALYVFFDRTILGKALRATAVNRLGARLVGVRTALSGQLAFLIAAAIGALSGVLIAPVTTVFYDSGFLIGLKGFVAAIVGGLVSYPLAAAAAVFVGIVEAFASFWASSFKEIIVFMIIIPVLLVRSLTTTHTEDEE